MNKTKIEWCDFTVNPVKYRDGDGKSVWACVKVSAGCAHCYAESLAKRYGRGGPYTVGHTAKVTPYLDEAELKQMLSVKRLPPGSRVFVGDMTDIFGEWVPDEMLDRMFAVFALRPDVVFQVLTKRPERMREWERCTSKLGFYEWPLSNVWLGTSVEDQAAADKRIPELLATPAAVRFLSCEPLLSELSIEHWLSWPEGVTGPSVDWVIVGGESGPGARPMDVAMDVAWARSLVSQCRAAGVAVFVKQLGAKPYTALDDVTFGTEARGAHPYKQMAWVPRYGENWGPLLRDRKGGDMSEWPEDLRIREFPR